MVSERLSPVIHVFRYATDDIHKQQNSAVFLFDFLALSPPPLCSFRLYFLQVFCMYLSPPLPPSLFSIRHFFLKKKNYLVFALSANSRHFFIVHGSDLGFSGFPRPYLVCAILATSLCCSDEGRWCWKIPRFEIRCVQWARCSETRRLVVKQSKCMSM